MSDKDNAMSCVLSPERINAIGEMDISFKEALQLAANEGAAKAREWQPIETAPREWKTDGTGVTILVSLPPIGALKAPDARRVYEARWSEGENTFTSVNGFAIYSAATHWMPMPLPQPPERDHG